MAMTVAEQTTRRVYSLAEISAMFADARSAIAEFGWSDRDAFPNRFVEVQIWDGTVVTW